jgi:hypothetical protein
MSSGHWPSVVRLKNLFWKVLPEFDEIRCEIFVNLFITLWIITLKIIVLQHQICLKLI